MAEVTPPVETSEGESWIILRSPVILMDLPVPYRWEVTRRHPYYLRFWNLAHQSVAEPSTDPEEGALQESAVGILRAIGVTGDPPHPGSSAASLSADALSQIWESGAISPLTFRGLVGMLLADLPPELRQAVGELLTAGTSADADEEQERYERLLALTRLSHPALDRYPNRPVVGINLQAPQRVITEAIERLTRHWKEEQEIPERRRRDDKLEKYLAVWDLREGWAGDHYENTQEHTLHEIALQQRLPLGTVANRYRSAFRLIVGRDYTWERWARVLGFLKLADAVDPKDLHRLTARGSPRIRQPRLVPETVLGTSIENLSRPPVNTAGISDPEIALVDVILDIQALLAQDLSNAEIAHRLELNHPAALELIEAYRQRRADGL
jgi:hypothetical protein